MKQLTTKAYGFKAAGDGIVEAYVAVFGNVDSYNERIRYGAFNQSITQRMPKVVWSHDFNRPIGKTLDIREVPAGSDELPNEIKDYGGLYVKGQLALKTRDGADMYEHLVFGSIDEFSFGFEVKNSEAGTDGVTELTELVMYEWSPVLVGANPLTQVVNVRSRSLDDKLEIVQELLNELSGHTKAYGEMREKAGRTVSKQTHKLMSAVAGDVERAAKTLKQFLKEHDPDRDTTDEEKAAQLQMRKASLKLRFTNSFSN